MKSNIRMNVLWVGLAAISLCDLYHHAHAGTVDLTVLTASPQARILDAPINSSIVITFDRPIDPASINSQSFWAFGRWSGTATGAYSFSKDNATVTLTPEYLFSAGEQVMVVLSHDIEGADGVNLRSAGYSYQFWIKSRPADLNFSQVQSFSVRTTPGQHTQAYGGIGSDLNGDRWLDISVVNEITADLRTCLNRADNSGTFHNFIQPPAPLGDLASPSEPTDFNRDGKVDVCVANGIDDTISILLGDGDGTFAPQQQVTVGATPYGVMPLDADGDGDMDIVNTNFGPPSVVSLLINVGDGQFEDPTFFGASVTGERGLTVADMNEDNILDLIVGGHISDNISVLLGNGDGTFTLSDVQGCGGETRIVVCGDVNGDGHEDVASGNGLNDNASILLGDGNGGLGPPTIYPIGDYTGPVDLGDLDGDGDLDWVISNFQGVWQLLLNNGSGTFTLDQEFDPPQAASCAVMMDIDNDRDLDLALIDEIADIVQIKKNSGTTPTGDVNNDGNVDVDDLLVVINNWGPCPKPPATCDADLNGDDEVNVDDLLIVINNWN